MKSILTSQGILRLGVVLVVVLGLLGGGFAFFRSSEDKATANSGEVTSDEAAEVEIPVKVVHPRFDKSFTMTEKRPADVRPYFTADLETRVPGIVEPFPYDVGSKVKEGEELIHVSVPDWVARRNQRQADLDHAKAVVDQKKAEIDVAIADWEAAEAKVKAYVARESADKAYMNYRKKQRDRYLGLLEDRAIDAKLVDEQEDQLLAAFEKVNADEQQVISAKADAKAAKTRIEEAKAALEEAKAKVKVAEAELKYAQAMLDYSIIKAPFDGVIVRRHVDPGFFVQNAGDGHATPLLTIERNDIVTIVMWLPDVYAAYLTPKTEAIFETPALPGIKIRGKVTRYPPSLVNPENDRTMMVEVDLWNRSPQKFQQIKDDKKFRAGLKKGMPEDPEGGLPVVPQIEGVLQGGREMHLMPGMFGQMTLILRNFNNVYMLPSQAITYRGGVPYIYVVKDGKAHLQPVKVQVDDGKLAKVDLINEREEIIGELTGKEEVIVSNQGELDEGIPVKPSLVEEWKQLEHSGDHNDKH